MIYVLFIALCFFNEAFTNQVSNKLENDPEKSVESNPQAIRRSQINNFLERLPKSVPLGILDRHPGTVEAIKWSSDNVHIATYANDDMVRVWNTETEALIEGIGSPTAIRDFAWSPDGRRIAITHDTNSVWICHLDTVFAVERAMEALSTEQLGFIDLFFGEKPLTDLTKKHTEIIKTLPEVLKECLMDQLRFNKKGSQPNSLR